MSKQLSDQLTLMSHLKQVTEFIHAQTNPAGRTIIGIAGPPASGKSTLAQAVVDHFNQGTSPETREAALLPMDGYHLDNSILVTRGLLARKGAPQTFDALGFYDALYRVRSRVDETQYYPRFDRGMDVAIANAIEISPMTRYIIVEGNYLLLNAEHWNKLPQLFDATVFLRPSLAVIRQRLMQRWLDHGYDEGDAERKVNENDIPNAELVLEQAMAAGLELS